jgi:hypothetical protein
MARIIIGQKGINVVMRFSEEIAVSNDQIGEAHGGRPCFLASPMVKVGLQGLIGKKNADEPRVNGNRFAENVYEKPPFIR